MYANVHLSSIDVPGPLPSSRGARRRGPAKGVIISVLDVDALPCRRGPIMRYVALLVLGAAGWLYFYVAAAYQYEQDYTWAYEICGSQPNFCDSPSNALLIAIAAVFVLFAIDIIRS